MVNFIGFQRKNFCQSSSDLIQKNHAFQCILTWVLLIVLTCRYNHWIIIVMPELPRIMTLSSLIKPEYRAIWVPFSDCWAVGNYCFFSMGPDFRSNTLWMVIVVCPFLVWVYWVLVDCFVSKNIGGISFQSDCWNTTDDGVSMKQIDSFVNFLIYSLIVHLHKVYRVLCQPSRLVGVLS